MDSPKLSLKKYAAVITVLLAIVMTVLDITVVNVALPVMARDFAVSESDSVWIVTIYQLVITMLLLPMSAIGDKYSYRQVMLVGIALFVLASVLCALSGSLIFILVSRAFQGIGGACVMAVNVALVRLIYPSDVLGRGLALNAMVIAIATAAGPTIAGAILSITTWHWLFIINVPIGIIALIIGIKLLPENPPRTKNLSFDKVSAISNMVVFGLIFYSVGKFAKNDHLILSGILLLAGIILGIFYLKRQTQQSEPLLPVDLFRNKTYSLSIATYMSSFIAQTVIMIALPFLFINNLEFDEMTTGLLMTPWPLATLVVSPVAARLAEHFNPGRIAAIGMAVFVFGATFLLLETDMSKIDIAWRMVVCGIGFGLFQTPNNIIMIQSTPISRSGAAGGMQGTSRLVGQTLGSTIVTILFAINSAIPSATRFCLIISIVCALLAGIFSLQRML